MIKVSIIVPVYNGSKYLAKCLDSLCTQTLYDIEIICINDASTDNSLELLELYSKKDNRVQVVVNEVNKGVSYSRNKGIDLAKGEYIGFVDSDDWVDLDFFEKLYLAGAASNADIAKGDIYQISGAEKSRSIIDNAKIRNAIINNEFVGTYFSGYFYMAIYKSSLIKERVYFPSITNGEDNVFTVRATLAAKSYAIVDDANYYYFINSSSTTSNWNEVKLKSLLEHFRLLLSDINNANISKEDYLNFFSNVLLRDIMVGCYENVLPSTPALRHFKLDVIYLLQEIYLKCKYLPELKKNYYKPYYSILENKDIDLAEFENLYFKIGKNKKTRYYLFGFIKVLTTRKRK